MEKVRIIDLQRKKRLTVRAYVWEFRCERCGVKFPYWRYQKDEPRQCIYCQSAVEPCVWGIRWERLKWEKYFDELRKQLGLGSSFSPFIVKDEGGRFYLQFMSPNLLFYFVDNRLIPIEVEFRQ